MTDTEPAIESQSEADPPGGPDVERGGGAEGTPPMMALGEHLEDLRRRLMFAMAGVALVLAFTLYHGRALISWLCVPLLEAQQAAGVRPGAYTLSPIAGFAAYLKVSLAAAVVIALPWVLYQVWRFIEGGLYAGERRVVALLTPFSAVMTALGVAFLYYVMLPVCLWFLLSFSASFPMGDPGGILDTVAAVDQPVARQSVPRVATLPVLATDPPSPTEGQVWLRGPQRELCVFHGGQVRSVSLQARSLLNPMIEIGQYLGFAAAMGAGIVIAFQLPVAMVIAGWAGVVEARQLRRYRRHCIVGCFALGMLLTPADVLSMLLLAVPLWGLFELGLVLMDRAGRRDSVG